jgi:hypothetical protein
MEGRLNAEYCYRWALSQERHYSGLVERFKGDVKQIGRLACSEAQAFGYVNDGSRDRNSHTNAQGKNDECRFSVLARFELVVPSVKHLHQGTNKACSQHQPNHPVGESAAHQEMLPPPKEARQCVR